MCVCVFDFLGKISTSVYAFSRWHSFITAAAAATIFQQYVYRLYIKMIWDFIETYCTLFPHIKMLKSKQWERKLIN